MAFINRMCKYFSHKLIDRTGETIVFEKDTNMLKRGNFYLGKKFAKEHLATLSLYDPKVFGRITLSELKVKPFLIEDWNLKVFLWF